MITTTARFKDIFLCFVALAAVLRFDFYFACFGAILYKDFLCDISHLSNKMAWRIEDTSLRCNDDDSFIFRPSKAHRHCHLHSC
jgi:hypothetical protein